MNQNPDFYKILLENIYDGVYFVDVDRRITFWNRGAERITGFKAEEVVGRVALTTSLCTWMNRDVSSAMVPVRCSAAQRPVASVPPMCIFITKTASGSRSPLMHPR